eukprot:5183508-Prymnesium_polylepis.1
MGVPELCVALSTRHGRGWWTRDIEQAFDAYPQSLWALPGNGALLQLRERLLTAGAGNGAGVRAGAASLGALGGKLH